MVGLILGIWYFAGWLLRASGDPIAYEKLPWPHLIVQRIVEYPDTFAQATWTTLQRALLGFAIGSLVAFGLSVLLVQARWIESSVMPYLVGMQMIPLVALVPLVRTILHDDGATRIYAAAWITMLSVCIASVRGLRSTPPDAIELMRTYEAGRLKMLRYLSVPTALPYVFSGLRVAAPLSIIGAIVVDLVGGTGGLGYLILTGLTFGQPLVLWGAMLIALLLGVAMSRSVAAIEQAVAPWQVGIRARYE